MKTKWISALMHFHSCCRCAEGVKTKKPSESEYVLFICFLYSLWKIFQHLYPLGRHHFPIYHFIDSSTCFVFSKASFKNSLQIKISLQQQKQRPAAFLAPQRVFTPMTLWLCGTGVPLFPPFCADLALLLCKPVHKMRKMSPIVRRTAAQARCIIDFFFFVCSFYFGFHFKNVGNKHLIEELPVFHLGLIEAWRID